MTAPPTADVVPVDASMRDFSRPKDPIVFTVDDDTFIGPRTIPADDLVVFGQKFEQLNEPGVAPQVHGLTDLVEIFLDPASFTRLRERLGDRANPISLKQLDDICNWLMEQHGMRPTLPPSDSSSPSSSPESGTDSTASAPPEDSIPSDSPSPDS